MSRFDGKIAVFICGPVRYVSLVSKRLEEVMAGHEYDCFYHLWKTDLGNKVRQQEETDTTELLANPRTKVLIRQEAYSPDDFREAIGLKTGSNSSINATMGMFFSVNLLCHYLAQLPDADKYRYVLRLRTDCAIINDDLANLLDPSPDVITLADMCLIPPDWVSDHIAFGRKESFFQLWKFDNMGDIYKFYQAGERNPEKALAARIRNSAASIRLNRALVLFKDYHIVYYPPRDNAPKWIVDTLNTVGVAGFFASPTRYYNPAETAAVIAEYSDKWRSRRLLSEAATALDHLDEVFSRMSIQDMAGMLIRIYHKNRQLADQLLTNIIPRIEIARIQQMVTECQQDRARWPDGSAWLENILLQYPKVKDLWLLGCQKLRTGAAAEAAVVLQAASDVGIPFPNLKYALATALAQLGMSLLAKGNASAAIERFDAAIALSGPVPNLSYTKAVALAQLGRYGSARCACMQELKVQPEHKGTLNLLVKLDEVLKTVQSAGEKNTGALSKVQ